GPNVILIKTIDLLNCFPVKRHVAPLELTHLSQPRDKTQPSLGIDKHPFLQKSPSVLLDLRSISTNDFAHLFEQVLTGDELLRNPRIQLDALACEDTFLLSQLPVKLHKPGMHHTV